MDSPSVAPSSYRNLQYDDPRTHPPDVRLLLWLTAALVIAGTYAMCFFIRGKRRNEVVAPSQAPSITIPSGSSFETTLEALTELTSRREHILRALTTTKFHMTCCNLPCTCVDEVPHSCVCQNAEEMCAICLEPYLNQDDICVSQNPACDHSFHLKCALEWLVRSRKCPCCRYDYFSQNGEVIKQPAPIETRAV